MFRSARLSVTSYFAMMVGTTFGSGFFPIAPGTVGSALAAVAWFFLPLSSAHLALALIAMAFGLGVWASGRCEGAWGKDPSRVNWDEVVGQFIALLWIPKTFIGYLLSFLLFRFFDILKPSPVRDAEKIPGGWGIMVDDVLAGVYANLVLQVGGYVIKKWF